LIGRSRTGEWDVEGGHFADRVQAFLIIALGESIIVTGATASTRGLPLDVVMALACAFTITATLCWLYFDEVAGQAQRHIAESDDPGRLARDAYSYLHLPIVAGIIMVAIADDLLIAHPDERLAPAGVAMMVGGPAVYLVGESLVRLRMRSSLSARRLVTVIALVLLGMLGYQLPALALSAGVAAILAVLTAWDRERSRSAIQDAANVVQVSASPAP
jgi:low temperature requirement protein LtrA